MGQQDTYLSNHFLIATPYLEDRRFAGTLTLICEHTSEGAMGVVVNQPLGMSLGDILSQLTLPGKPVEAPVYGGGPVMKERGFVLHRPHGEWQNTLAVNDNLALTSSKDILEAMARGEGPGDFLMLLGYSGWSAGQLEQELAGNTWLTCQASEQILFDCPPEDRLDSALKQLGVNPSHLSGSVGHA
ncbi:MAG: YqgE/AlgH family protein [Halomonadaceae bacterium]|nr:MAG: YqgE/AlgH family protein [Halomonadaceae bacterium]